MLLQEPRPVEGLTHKVGEALVASGTAVVAVAGTVAIEAYVGGLNLVDRVRQTDTLPSLHLVDRIKRVGPYVSNLHLVDRLLRPAA